jgi:hypothetical protein
MLKTAAGHHGEAAAGHQRTWTRERRIHRASSDSIYEGTYDSRARCILTAKIAILHPAAALGSGHRVDDGPVRIFNARGARRLHVDRVSACSVEGQARLGVASPASDRVSLMAMRHCRQHRMHIYSNRNRNASQIGGARVCYRRRGW